MQHPRRSFSRTIGFYTHDGFFRATPAASRAVHRTVSALRRAGHLVTEFRPPSVVGAMLLLMDRFVCDARSLTAHSGTHPFDPAVLLVLLSRTPKILRGVIANLFDWFLEDGVLARILRSFGNGGPEGRSSSRVLQMRAEIEAYRAAFARDWEDAKVDFVISPVHAIPPVPPESFPFVCAGSSYSMLPSLLDYPSGVIPSIAPATEDDRVPNPFAYVHGQDEPPLEGAGSHLMPLLANPQTVAVAALEAQQQALAAVGPMPVRHGEFNFLGVLGVEEWNGWVAEVAGASGCCAGVQIIGRRFEDEKVLAGMQVVRRALDADPSLR
ncbi:amidase signature domain-containing protein [Blyttiomyces helicus]|uniref:Amidase signature domain-containing protein n=1 Tax=Blyttiomyces helicus TaxID=388810 RepID=A0A4P9WP08_9FUNG|nr:amidase signature domain-containing protein [Blyttiomyces helicus]|eukprot:RKO94744.1 amidase signature domain-containing protein [Blyttiomyces helicus]